MNETSAPGSDRAHGHRIHGQHCGGCGQPDATRDRIHYSTTSDRLGIRELATTPCCGRLPCHGYVASAPWIGRESGRQTWACCRGVAERVLGEGAYLWLPPDLPKEAP